MTKKILDTKLPILPIGAIAQSLNVHQRTLRIYDKEGILSPTRTDKNRRYYSLDDLEKAKLILFLTRNLALNLAGVKIILALVEELKIPAEESLDFVKKSQKVQKLLLNCKKTILKKPQEKVERKNLSLISLIQYMFHRLYSYFLLKVQQ